MLGVARRAAHRSTLAVALGSLGPLGVAWRARDRSASLGAARRRPALGVVRREVFDDKPPDARLFVIKHKQLSGQDVDPARGCQSHGC